MPEFKPESGEWFTKDAMRRMLGIGDINTIDNWRRKFGNAYEHAERSGVHRGVWLYARDWLPAYFAATADSPATGADPKVKVDHVDRLKKAQADREELRYLKDLEVLLHVRDATRDVDAFGSAVRKGIEQLPPPCQEIMLAAIDDAENEWIRRHGDGIQRSDNAEDNGPPGGVEPAHNGRAPTPPADSPRVRRKVRHDAGKRAKGRRKVQR